MPDMEEAIIEHLRDGSIPISGGNPEDEDYPLVIVNVLSETPGEWNTSDAYTEEIFMQITVASVESQLEANEIGNRALAKMQWPNGTTRPHIRWDEGEPGRELTRWRGATRKMERQNEGPGGATVFYFVFDATMKVQRNIA